MIVEAAIISENSSKDEKSNYAEESTDKQDKMLKSFTFHFISSKIHNNLYLAVVGGFSLKLNANIIDLFICSVNFCVASQMITNEYNDYKSCF